MPLVQATLASELLALEPVGDEAGAIDNLAGAWENYFAGASVLGIPTTGGALAGATTAMKGALVGMSVAGAGAAKLQAGIVAFWAVVAVSAATIWATVPPPLSATPPPGLGGIAAALTPVFVSNAAGSLSLADSANAVAAVLHPLQLGGIALLPIPPAGPGPQPIL